MYTRLALTLIVVCGALGVATGSAIAADPIRLSTGGSDTSLTTTMNVSGTYIASSAIKKKKVVIRLFAVRGGVAVQLPALPFKPDEGIDVVSREDGGVPCVTADVRSSPYVACLEGGAWKERRFTGEARTQSLNGVVSYAGSQYAFLDATDRGAFEKALSDERKLRRFRFQTVVRRWDGTAWVAAGSAVPDFKYALTAITVPIFCAVAVAPGSCDAPLLFSLGFSLKSKKVTLGTSVVVAGRWVDDPTRRMGNLDVEVVGTPGYIDGQLLIPRRTGKRLELISRGSAGVKTTKVGLLAGDEMDANVGVVAGRAWIAWADGKVPKTKRATQGKAQIHVAPLDTAAATAGAPQSFGTVAYSLAAGVPSPFVLEADGALYVAYVESRKSGDVVVVAPGNAAG